MNLLLNCNIGVQENAIHPSRYQHTIQLSKSNSAIIFVAFLDSLSIDRHRVGPYHLSLKTSYLYVDHGMPSVEPSRLFDGNKP